MIVNANPRGHSFKGAVAYITHDIERAETGERVAWTVTGNLPVTDSALAARIMAWTEQQAEAQKQQDGNGAGRKAEAGGVYHYSLSWSPTENPNPEHMQQAAAATLKKLGLHEHQYVMSAHTDTAHPHVHVVVSLTHPDTGKRNSLYNDRHKLQKWAVEYERKHGIQCAEREKAFRDREAGKPPAKPPEPDHKQAVTRLYTQSDSGPAFVSALHAEGFELAAARRGGGFVVIDESGDIQKLARLLDIEEKGKAKTAAINARLADIDRAGLADADATAAQRKQASAEAVAENREQDDIAPAVVPDKEDAPPVSAWELIGEYADYVPDEVPQDVPDTPPQSPPVVEIMPEQNQGTQTQLAAFNSWMQEKIVAAYEYVMQKILNRQHEQHEQEKGIDR